MKKISSLKQHVKFLLLSLHLVFLTGCHFAMTNKETTLSQTVDLSQSPIAITILETGNLTVLS